MLFVLLYVYNSLFIDSSHIRKGLTGTGTGVVKVSSSDDEISDSYETETTPRLRS